MQRPLMTAEQTNVPQNDEELKVATEKRLAAEKVEEEAHEAARVAATDEKAAGLLRNEQIAEAARSVQRTLYEQAVATGTLPHHINATLFTAAVIAANASDGVESVVNYVRSLANNLKMSNKPKEGELQ